MCTADYWIQQYFFVMKRKCSAGRVSVCVWPILSWVRCAWRESYCNTHDGLFGGSIDYDDEYVRRQVCEPGQLKESAEKQNVRLQCSGSVHSLDWRTTDPRSVSLPCRKPPDDPSIQYPRSSMISSVIPMMWWRPIDRHIYPPFLPSLFVSLDSIACSCFQTTQLSSVCSFVCLFLGRGC